MTTTPPVPGPHPAFEIEARQGHGTTRAGHRRIVPVAGGHIRGLCEAQIVPEGPTGN